MTDFETIAEFHRARYPLMQPQDFGKLAFQSAMGPEHMITDEQAAADALFQEWQTVSVSEPPCGPEPLGNGLCRFHLAKSSCSPDAAAVLAKLFVQTAGNHTGGRADLQARLAVLERLPVEGMQTWLAGYRRMDCPAVHHSELFRSAYHPHYRILSTRLADCFAALLYLCQTARAGLPVTVSLRGFNGREAEEIFSLLRGLLPHAVHTVLAPVGATLCARITPDASGENPTLRPAENERHSRRFPVGENRSVTVASPCLPQP